MNTDFGKLNNGVMEYAPNALGFGGYVYISPNEQILLAAGYKRITDAKPQSTSAGYYAANGWRETESAIERVYEFVPYSAHTTSRTFSKLKLEVALFNLCKLSALDAFIDSQVMTNANGETMPLRRAYDSVSEFSESAPMYAQYFAAVKSALGITDADAEAIMAQCVVEGD